MSEPNTKKMRVVDALEALDHCFEVAVQARDSAKDHHRRFKAAKDRLANAIEELFKPDSDN